MARGVLDLAKQKGLQASVIHFASIWGTALLMLPAAGASKPATKWPATQIFMDALFHSVYALAAGAVYDGMKDTEKKEQKRR